MKKIALKMKKYRIVKYTNFSGKITYLSQKRLFGFLWWYDWLEDGYWCDGYCDTIEEAMENIKRDKYKTIKEIVYIE